MRPGTTAGPNCSACWWTARHARRCTSTSSKPWASNSRSATMSASEIPFHGVRVRYDSTKSYDELVAALLADIGERPAPIDDISKSFDGWEMYEQEVQSHVGPSGFMLFGRFNHGAWLTKAGIDRKVLRVIL